MINFVFKQKNVLAMADGDLNKYPLSALHLLFLGRYKHVCLVIKYRIFLMLTLYDSFIIVN